MASDRLRSALVALGDKAHELSTHGAVRFCNSLDASGNAVACKHLVETLAPYVDAVLAAAAYEAGVDRETSATPLSDAIDGELLYRLDVAAEPYRRRMAAE